MRRFFIILTMGLSWGLSWGLSCCAAEAAGIEAAALKACLIKNSGPEQDESFRRLLVTLLQDNVASAKEAKEEVTKFSLAILSLASGKCGLTLDQMQNPAVKQAVSEYGAFVGQRIMAAALAKLGISGD